MNKERLDIKRGTKRVVAPRVEVFPGLGAVIRVDSSHQKVETREDLTAILVNYHTNEQAEKYWSERFPQHSVRDWLELRTHIERTAGIREQLSEEIRLVALLHPRKVIMELVAYTHPLSGEEMDFVRGRLSSDEHMLEVIQRRQYRLQRE